MKLNRKSVERMLANADMRPQKKQTYRGYEIYTAEGFTAKPHVTLQSLGVEEGEFTFGAHTTAWFVGRDEERFELGQIVPSDALKDPHNSLANERLALAEKAAKQAIDTKLAQRKLHA